MSTEDGIALSVQQLIYELDIRRVVFTQIPRKGNSYIRPPMCWYQGYAPTSLLFNGYWTEKRPEREADHSNHSVPLPRINGATPPLLGKPCGFFGLYFPQVIVLLSNTIYLREISGYNGSEHEYVF
jgi:hypothetical protein